ARPSQEGRAFLLGSGRGLGAGRCGNGSAEFPGGLYPHRYRVSHVGERFLRRFAIAEATGKVGNARRKTAAILGRERRDDHRIFKRVHHASWPPPTAAASSPAKTGRRRIPCSSGSRRASWRLLRT